MGHYIENCVLWGTQTTRAMVAQIEQAEGAPLHEVIFSAQTMPEHCVYGLFADTFPARCDLSPDGVSCTSFWPKDNTGPIDMDSLCDRLQPKHPAIAVQSTHDIALTDRTAFYERAARDFAWLARGVVGNRLFL